jgi:4-amino-4-deoxy-L-arabinose transferase-like glycosyltransferase
MSKRTCIWLLVGILALATFFRFYQLTTIPPGLYPDEAMDGANAQNVAATSQFKVFYPEDNGREGLYVNILAVAFKFHLLPASAPWSIRFPAAVAGVLTVFAVYLLVAELFRERDEGYAIALLAAFFLATSFWHINFSRIGFRAILAPLCLTWALWFLIKSLRARPKSEFDASGKPRDGARHSPAAFWYAIAAGIIFGAGFYTYIAFRIAPLLLLIFLPFFKKDWRFWQRAIVFLLTTFIVALPIGLFFVQNPAAFFGRTSEISVANAASPVHDFLINVGKTALMFNYRGDGNWRQNVAGAPELWWPVGILFLLGIVLTLVWLFRGMQIRAKENKSAIGAESEFGLWLIGSWFILGLLPEILSDEGIPHALRSLLSIVPTMVLAAIGGVWLYKYLIHYFVWKNWGKAIANTIAVIFFVAVAVYGYYDYFVVWAQNPNVPGSFNADYVAIGDAINALPPSTQKYVVVVAGGVVDYGIPVPATTVMYITNSFVPNAAAQKDVNNIHYLLPDETSTIPAGAASGTIFYLN